MRAETQGNVDQIRKSLGLLAQRIDLEMAPHRLEEFNALIEQPDLHDDIKEGDAITVKMNEHVDYNGKTYPIAALPENLMDIIQAGGLVKAMRKRNGLD